ncbi:hypothetical protein K7X08_019783 [Anisodus acutangulus]|uniref:Uncharacterized protein n=1 Tax=Anisodus acutangulus TaxID=402998 RepID=A0A9Q1MS55_9SOLA|nr:hypothetical protein K7X08_019783 [Anisodus acutangulus]
MVETRMSTNATAGQSSVTTSETSLISIPVETSLSTPNAAALSTFTVKSHKGIEVGVHYAQSPPPNAFGHYSEQVNDDQLVPETQQSQPRDNVSVKKTPGITSPKPLQSKVQGINLEVQFWNSCPAVNVPLQVKESPPNYSTVN